MATPQPTPFVLVGDLLGQPTGLSRILTDLAVRLHGEQQALGLDVRVCGWANWAVGVPKHGVPVDDVEGTGIKCWAFHDLTAWGAGALTTAYRHWFGDRPGIVLTIWDAHRCFGLTDAQIPVKWWGYIPVDGVNVNGEVGGGPVREALARYSRLLAYTDFGSAAILKTLIDAAPYKADPVVPHLPHGLNLDVWAPAKVDPAAMAKMRGVFARTIREGAMLCGVVATNQPRKDWGLVAATLAELRRRGHNLHGWWHCDAPVSDAWSLPQLAEDFGLEESVVITTRLTDYELAAAYTCCAATIAPGRGEGFCYPIAESLAIGTPVVHANYAGGAEFTPPAWRLPVEAYHLEGAYGVRRPIVSPGVAADVLELILGSAKLFDGPRGASPDAVTFLRATTAQYVKDLDWTVLWPKWRQWIQEGL